MKVYIYCLYIVGLFIAQSVTGQKSNFISTSAVVSFISSQHIYLKLESTEGLQINDTLFIETGSGITAALKINYLSKSSCAAINLLNNNYSPNDRIVLYRKKGGSLESEQPNEIESPASEITPSINDPDERSSGLNQRIDGRLSISSYSNLTANSNLKNYQRWRYSLLFDAINLLNSNFSFESYINFSYRADRWNIPGENIWDKLKIYSLALNYKISDTYNLSLGRKINNKFSSIGAVDGLQFESHFKFIDAGIVAGTRPDFTNFGLSSDYLQFGAYVSRTDSLVSRQMQNTLSVFQISKNARTDRRFMYFQHSNNIVPDLFLFISGEVDLYKRENGIDKNSFELTNLYLSGRYAPIRWMSITTSYDIRKNVMYYETYKNIADSLFDAESRQGFRTRVNLKPIKYVSLTLQYGTRSKIGDKRTSNNYGATVNYSKVPFIDVSTSLSFTILNTSYVNANMYGITFYKYLLDGLLNVNIGYRRLEYEYLNNSFALNQNLIQLDAGLRIFDKDYLSLNIESNIEQSYSGSRIYLNFTKRF